MSKAKYPKFSPVYRYLYNRWSRTTTFACSVLVALLIHHISLSPSSSTVSILETNGTAKARQTLSSKELEVHLNDVRGEDQRLMRWSAKSHTRKRQRNGGCDALPQALNVILAASETTTPQTLSDVTNALEYTTFCITDNPEQRRLFSTCENGIHAAVVSFLDDAMTSRSASAAAAAHVIYIASFDNAQNQEGFFHAGAVQKLSKVVVDDESSSPLQLMWALAALQNLMASYCDTEGNGRCKWKFQKEWKDDPSKLPVLQVSSKMTVTSDGQPMREAVQKDTALMDRVIELTLRGPVKGEMSDTNPYVGHNAKAGVHDYSPNILPWAAAGMIKNLVLDATARAYILHHDRWKELHFALCRLGASPDWLEQNKGESALGNLLPTDTCWFEKDDDPHGALCFDDVFVDGEGYTCSDYNEKVSASECSVSGILDKSKTAKDCCCHCGGGNPDGQWTRKVPKA